MNRHAACVDHRRGRAPGRGGTAGQPAGRQPAQRSPPWTDLIGQAGSANDALAAHTRTGEFVTGQLLRVDLRRGTATIINAGHPLPLRLRHGRIEEVHLDIDLPFGLQPSTSYREQAFRWRRVTR